MKNDNRPKIFLVNTDGSGVSEIGIPDIITVGDLRAALKDFPDEVEVKGMLGSEAMKSWLGPIAKKILCYPAPCSPTTIAIHLVGE